MIENNSLDHISNVFKALGDKNRLKIIKLLASNKKHSFCVTEIAEKINISQPAVSQHIKVLKEIDMLLSHREGFRVYHTVNVETMRTLVPMVENLYLKAFKKCYRDYNCSECQELANCR